MKRNKLYNITKGNLPYMRGRLFALGTSSLKGSDDVYSFSSKSNTTDTADTAETGNKSSSSSGKGGNSSFWGNAAANVGRGLAMATPTDSFKVGGREFDRGAWDLLDPTYYMADGRNSEVGDKLSDTGVQLTKTGNPILMLAGAALKIGGSFANAGWGVDENKKNTEALKKNTARAESMSNIFSGSTSTSDLMSRANYISNNPTYNEGDLFFNDGWFVKGKAAEESKKLLDKYDTAVQRQMSGLSLGASNIDKRRMDDLAANFIYDKGGFLGMPNAYTGGATALVLPMNNTSANTGALGMMQQNRYFDSIDKRSEALSKGNSNQMMKPSGAMYGLGGMAKGRKYDAGGLQYNFLNEFSEDPIGAAVRYNQGLEEQMAMDELLRQQEQRAAENAALQQGLAATQQGLEDLRLTPPNFNINIEQNWGDNGLMSPSIEVTPEVTPELTVPERIEEVKMSNNQKKNWDYIQKELKKSGKFNDIQIEGIRRNLQRESSIDPTLTGDSGSAIGIAQWRGNRQPQDTSLAGQTQHLINTLSSFDGTDHWIGRDNYNGFLNARTPEEAHYYIAKGYERPKESILKKVKRDSDMSLKRINAFGGELGTNGTDFTNGLLYVGAGGSHEDNPFEGVPMGVDDQGIPNLVEEGETIYNDYVFSDRLKVPSFMYKELGLGGVMKSHGKKHSKEISFADASKKIAQESEQRPNDPISQAGLEAGLARLAEVQEAERMRIMAKERNNTANMQDTQSMSMMEYAEGGKIGRKYSGKDSNHAYDQTKPTTPSILSGNPFLGTFEDYENLWNLPVTTAAKEPQGLRPLEQIAKDKSTPDREVYVTDNGTNLAVRNISKPDLEGMDADGGGEYNPGNTYQPKTYPTWMRYAPALGILAELWNRPDYTYADKLEAAANRAGIAPNVEYKPIGDYLKYEPEDIWYEQNRLNANARATDRAIQNNAGPLGTQMAALIANGYNNQLASGELYRKALEYNDAKRQAVADFNRRTNMFNSQMDLEAQMANARYGQQARQMGLSGLAQAAAMRDAIDQRVGAARSANLSNFLTSLGNIGRENFAMNQINWDRSRRYHGDLRGRSGYNG